MLQKANILITGPPGCGKSTLIARVTKGLQTKGVKIGGITTPEFRTESGRRAGFLIRDIATGKEAKMAAIGFHSKIHVGKYGVDTAAVRDIGVTAIEQAVKAADIVVIDEIGKMELSLPEFQECVVNALDSSKPILGTVGLYLSSPFVNAVKNREDVRILMLRRNQQTEILQLVSKLLDIPDL
jgi:nucleoside-triphosphatase